MELDLAAQLALLFSCFFAGAIGGVVFELMTALRILLGAYRPPDYMKARYARPLPLIGRAPVFDQTGKRRAWCAVVTAVTDVLFCLFLAITAILLFYRYNDGSVRLLFLLALILGLLASRTILARAADRLCAYLAFGLAVSLLYLRALVLLPLKGLAALWRALILRPLRALAARCRHAMLARKSAALCKAQLALAAVGLDAALLQKEGRQTDEEKKQAVGNGAVHSCADPRGLLRIDLPHGGAFDGAEPHAPRDRRAKGKDRSLRGARRDS